MVMAVQKKYLVCLSLVIIALLWNLSKETMVRMKQRNPYVPEILPKITKVPSEPDGKNANEPRFHYAEVQLLVDNSTIVYVGHYDDREAQAVVKIPSFMNQKKKIHNFTCLLHYSHHKAIKVDAKVRLLTFSWRGNSTKLVHRIAFIICPVKRVYGAPAYVLLAIDRREHVTTNVTVIPPAKENNTLTRCIKHFVKSYDNVQQLVWNIEFYRILGVDKQIFYLNSQTQRVLDILESYEKEGVVELRTFDLAKLPIKPSITIQNMVLQECLLSEMNTAKYFLFVDVDEIVFPRAHRDIVEMADFLFQKTDRGGKQFGSLTFREAFYPVNTSVTEFSFPNKATAREYNIDPLLHTKRYKTAKYHYGAKTLVKPKSVDVLFVHEVEAFINGDQALTVDDDIGIVNHYRKGIKRYLVPPPFTNTDVYRFSGDLISAVGAKFKGYKQQ